MNAQTSTRFRRTPMLLAMMIIATGQVGVSIYLPSLPLISRDLQVDQASAQMLVTLFLLGFGGSQLFYGALSDAVGRRPTFFAWARYLFARYCALRDDVGSFSSS